MTARRWALLSAAAVLLAIGAAQAVRTKIRIDGYHRADGVVRQGGSHPVISFDTQAGKTVTFTQNGFFVATPGQTQPVLYDENDPANTAVVDRFLPVWWMSAWLMVPGLILLGLTVLGTSPAIRGRYN